MNRGDGKLLPYSSLPTDFLPIRKSTSVLPIRKSTSFLPLSLPYSRLYKAIMLKLVDERSMRNFVSVNIPTNDLLMSKWKIVTLQDGDLADTTLIKGSKLKILVYCTEKSITSFL